MRGVRVALVEGGIRRTSITDQKGRYSFSGLRPGIYSVSALAPGFTKSEDDSDEPEDVPARGCGEINLVMLKNWPGVIRGRLVQNDGTPGPAGLKLDLIPVAPPGSPERSGLLIGATVRTDLNGEYSFLSVGPGFYKVVMNLYTPPTGELPYRTAYWPAADNERAASTVEINANTKSRQCDFRLPPALKGVPVKVVVLRPDGTPAPGAHANIGTTLDGLSSSAGSARTDGSGEFTFVAIESFDYTVDGIFAFSARMAEPVHFSAADANRRVVVQLISNDEWEKRIRR
jgi:hypothetical protein